MVKSTNTKKEIFDTAVKKLNNLFKKCPDMEEGLLQSTMLGIVESVPMGIQKSLYNKFTFMLGIHMGFTKKQIQKEIDSMN